MITKTFDFEENATQNVTTKSSLTRAAESIRSSDNNVLLLLFKYFVGRSVLAKIQSTVERNFVFIFGQDGVEPGYLRFFDCGNCLSDRRNKATLLVYLFHMFARTSESLSNDFHGKLQEVLTATVSMHKEGFNVQTAGAITTNRIH